MKQERILFITTFIDPLNNNYRLCKLLQAFNTKVKVYVITTNFNHKKKTPHKKELISDNFTFIPVPFYKKNLSFERFFSHIIFAYRLRKHLKKLTFRPEKIYCSIPVILICCI